MCSVCGPVGRKSFITSVAGRLSSARLSFVSPRNRVSPDSHQRDPRLGVGGKLGIETICRSVNKETMHMTNKWAMFRAPPACREFQRPGPTELPNLGRVFPTLGAVEPAARAAQACSEPARSRVARAATVVPPPPKPVPKLKPAISIMNKDMWLDNLRGCCQGGRINHQTVS